MDREGKAFSHSYRESAFYFSPQNDAGYNLVAWSPFIEQSKALFYAAVQEFADELRILLKLQDPDDERKEDWDRYLGTINKKEFLDIIKAHEELVFKDGYSQLCVREGEFADYFAFDDHGIFYFYSHNPKFPSLCEGLGFEKRSAEPIYSEGHYQRQPADLKEKRQALIADLGLARVGQTN